MKNLTLNQKKSFLYDFCVKNKISRKSSNAKFYLKDLFRDIDLNKKDILDIGGGSGYISFYTALKGANNVICVEPGEEGSDVQKNNSFNELYKELNVDNVQLINNKIENIVFQDKFDIILLHNSINHLVNGNCEDLSIDNELENQILNIFYKIKNISKPNSRIIIVDNSKNHFFQKFGFKKHPFSPHIGFHDHETPEYWERLLSKLGFEIVSIAWVTPNSLKSIGQLFFNNYLSASILAFPFKIIFESKFK